MSEDKKAIATQDPTAVIMERLYMPAFFKRCSARGITPKTTEDASEMWKMAVMLRMHQAAAATPAEVEKPSVIKQASSRLAAMTFGTAPAVDMSDILADPELTKALQSVSA